MQDIREIMLDIDRKSAFQVLYAKQGDNDSRFIKITMTKNGEKIMPGSGDTAAFNGLKPDGNSFINEAVINDDGTITVELTDQVLAVDGAVHADVSIINSGSVLSTANFTINVEKKPTSDSHIESINEFNYIVVLAGESEAWAHGSSNYPEMDEDNAKYWAEQAQAASGGIDDVKEQAVAAKDEAVAAKDTAVSAKDDAITAKNAAIAAKDDAISAKNDAIDAEADAESAKDDAVTAKNAAETAQGYAEDARDEAEAWAHGHDDYPDMDTDNAKYWAEEAKHAAQGIPEAPENGKLYGRKDGAWNEVVEADPTVPSWAKAETKPTYSKGEIGLGNVDNTSDLSKPISTAAQAALNLKADASDLSDLSDDVGAIEAKIPSQASAQNQLADKAFVNSTVGNNTAIFRGTFDSVEELEAYSGAKTNNDYAFVVIYDETVTDEVKAYDRYKYNGSTWEFEFELNNSSFTAVQWAAINSGITADSVGLIGSALQKSGGTMTGRLVAQNNTNYATKQVRNIYLSTSDPTSADGANGDIWIRYEN